MPRLLVLALICNVVLGAANTYEYDVCCNQISVANLFYDGYFKINMSSLHANGWSYADIQLVTEISTMKMLTDYLSGGAVNIASHSPELYKIIGSKFDDEITYSTKVLRNKSMNDDNLLDTLQNKFNYSLNNAINWRRLPSGCTSRTLSSINNTDVCIINSSPLELTCVITPKISNRHDTNSSNGNCIYEVHLPVISELNYYQLVYTSFASSLHNLLDNYHTIAAPTNPSLFSQLLYFAHPSVFTYNLAQIFPTKWYKYMEYLIYYLDNIPYYAFNLVVGSVLYMYLEDLVDNRLIQFSIMISCGILLAVITFVILLFS